MASPFGTGPERFDRNPSPEPDASSHNRVHGNVIDTRGGECVAIKEAASHNEVAFNTCTGQHPRNGNSGAMDARPAQRTTTSITTRRAAQCDHRQRLRRHQMQAPGPHARSAAT